MKSGFRNLRGPALALGYIGPPSTHPGLSLLLPFAFPIPTLLSACVADPSSGPLAPSLALI